MCGRLRLTPRILALVLLHDEAAVLTAVELAQSEGVPTKTHLLERLMNAFGAGALKGVIGRRLPLRSAEDRGPWQSSDFF